MDIHFVLEDDRLVGRQAGNESLDFPQFFSVLLIARADDRTGTTPDKLHLSNRKQFDSHPAASRRAAQR
jgi:hypothetical protein